MGPVDTGGHSAASTQMLPAQGMGTTQGDLGSFCEPLALPTYIHIIGLYITFDPGSGDAGCMCPSFPSSGVYMFFTVFHLGRLATTQVPGPMPLEGASGHQAAAHRMDPAV